MRAPCRYVAIATALRAVVVDIAAWLVEACSGGRRVLRM